MILFVRLSLCHAASNCFSFFVSQWNRAIFWPPVLHVALYKTSFLDFWFRPPNVQNLLPKICTKSAISRLVWQIDRRCLSLLGSFRGWPIQWNHARCCGATADLVAYRLVSVTVQSAQMFTGCNPSECSVLNECVQKSLEILPGISPGNLLEICWAASVHDSFKCACLKISEFLFVINGLYFTMKFHVNYMHLFSVMFDTVV